MSRTARKHTILVAGPPMIKRIDAEIAERMQPANVDYVFFTPDGIFGIETDRLRNERAPKSLWLRAKHFLKLLRTLQPKHVELYFSNPYVMLPFYAMVTKLLGFPLVVWCRGSEILEFERRNRYRKLITRWVLFLSDWMILKEIRMLTEVARLKLARSSKLFFLPNKIKIDHHYSVARSSRIVLFLNAPQIMRHPEIIIHAIPSIIASVPDARFLFVGYRSGIEQQRISKPASEIRVENFIELLPYHPNARGHYENASLFVLPAERVFLNHSLIEAMERGVPPLVADVDPNVHDIVEHGVSGLVLPLDSSAWAHAIIELLKDEPRRQAMGTKARERVARDFNLEDKIHDLLTFYQNMVWKKRKFENVES